MSGRREVSAGILGLLLGVDRGRIGCRLGVP